MKNLIQSYNHDIAEQSENLYLCFYIDENRYAINVQQIVEIMKLPLLDYPQKLANNVVGLLNYNNLTINILDLRFYLNMEVKPYSLTNRLLIVRTDESIFGIIIDRIEDIIPFEVSKTEYFSFSEQENIIESLYKDNDDSISVISVNAIENLLKKGVKSVDIDVKSLFPNDEKSKIEFSQRNFDLVAKNQLNLVANAFSQDKFISFSLNENIFCISLSYVKEFIKNVSITKIPCELNYISGIMALRGDFISVINLSVFLGLEEIEQPSKKNNIIIVENENLTIGFLVDEIFNILEISEDSINENRQTKQKGIQSEVVLENKLYNILDMPLLLNDERFFVEENSERF